MANGRKEETTIMLSLSKPHYMSAIVPILPPPPPPQNPIVRFKDIPACSECRFFQPAEGYSRFRSTPVNPYLSKCTKFGTKNIITGKIKYNFAINNRLEEEKCGFEGNHFVVRSTSPLSTFHILAQMYENMDSITVF